MVAIGDVWLVLFVWPQDFVACTKTGDILGSPIYMSPEQLKGVKVTGATDIYSLGVTFYQLLTGNVPYSGDSIPNLAYQILNKKLTIESQKLIIHIHVQDL